jgi:CheY-like chemotaxis protein
MSNQDRGDGKILVVEDNLLVSQALSALLRDQGYETVSFSRGEPALTYLREHSVPRAALVDIHLPDISGLDVTRQIRQSFGNDLPIIILSGDTSIDTLRELPQAGATYFVSKPVNAGILLSQLKQWMAQT